MLRVIAIVLLAFLHAASGKVVEYDLTIAEETVAPAGKPVRGLTINGGIPAPTLRFTIGDTARIRVHNRLPRGETSTHWHGLLVPNEQDGISRVTTPPILAGQSHTFEFPLKHAGTYWYHSHTGLQEQRGLYGAIVVLPKGTPASANDHVLLLSDWTNENPDSVMKTLMRGSDWYSIKKGTAQSILGAAQTGNLKSYFKREWSRLMPMDISDVAYDAFLVNGRRSIALPGAPGTTSTTWPWRLPSPGLPRTSRSTSMPFAPWPRPWPRTVRRSTFPSRRSSCISPTSCIWQPMSQVS